MTVQKTSKEIGWNFDNSYARLPEVFYAKLHPTSVRSPELVLLNERLAEELGICSEALKEVENIQVFAGNRIPEHSEPLAQAYAGHQFGHFTMLGDGRALLLGEHVTPEGKRMDIQLKGSGKTPFSRGGDGRAALGPMLREYVISEAMHALGIPTSRSLAVVTTGERIFREDIEKGAILTRVATSHLRVGTFQYAARWTTKEHLKTLADYTLDRHCSPEEVAESENRYLYLLEEVIRRQAQLIAKWQLCGFIHGVMNTDNMTISGETIDYGPCAFMDVYDPLTVFSSIDHHGRYAYDNQPKIAQWNLARFAEALLPIIDDQPQKAIDKAEVAVARFIDLYEQHWLSGMRAKLGLFHEEEGDKTLIEDLLQWMHQHRADYTNTFLAITTGKDYGVPLFTTSSGKEWYERWKQRRDQQQQTREQSERLMKEHNPAVIPRNHRVEEALEAAVQEGDLQVMKRLLDVLANPYAHTSDQAEYAEPPPKSMLPYRTYCGT